MTLFKENKQSNLDLYTSTTTATLQAVTGKQQVHLTQQCLGRLQCVHGVGSSCAGDAPLA